MSYTRAKHLCSLKNMVILLEIYLLIPVCRGQNPRWRPETPPLSQIGVCLLLEWSANASAFVIYYMLPVGTYIHQNPLWVHRLQSVCKFVLVLLNNSR
jgi:hypothetical protein